MVGYLDIKELFFYQRTIQPKNSTVHQTLLTNTSVCHGVGGESETYFR